MARMSIEQKLADKVHENLIRMDFRPQTFAYYMSKCGYNIQIKLFDIVKGMIGIWASEYDEGEYRDSDDYYRVTVYARRLQDTLDGAPNPRKRK